ncbi:MAG: glycosyltransferase family 2 protein [Lachnospiraceae bacterium]|nr:glycosyltransferase family 2 protein [Lachnospiraceae bacterium]
MSKVIILMSTYNGALYIKEQLDSIFRQSYQNFELWIRDDGSKDDTVEIIKQYKSKLELSQAEKLTLVSNNLGNVGYMKSFWHLLQNCPKADAYAFCDQDDVWEADKLERGVQHLKKEDEKIPVLYTSRFAYYSGEMEFQEEGIRYPYEVTFDKVAFYTPAFGFTIMINDTLREKALSAKDLTDIPHDAWCLKVASALGKVVYDETVTARYRRHGSTVTHASASKWRLIREWLNKDILQGNLWERYWFLKRFAEEYGEELEVRDKEFIKLFKEQKCSLVTKIKRVCYGHRLRPTLGGEMALRLCFLLGK